MSNSYYFIKLYHEILDDPKMGLLSDKIWRRAIELFLFAGELGKGGNLPRTTEIAWRLRTSSRKLKPQLENLETVGILEKNSNGWTVVNFTKRQAADSIKERVKRHREKKRKDTYYGDKPVTNSNKDGNDTSNDSVTIRYTDIDIDKDKDITTAGSLSNFFEDKACKCPRGIIEAQTWEDDCKEILKMAGGDEGIARGMIDEAITILDNLKYSYNSPASLINTISKQLEKKKEGHSNGYRRNQKPRSSGGMGRDGKTPEQIAQEALDREMAKFASD